VVRHLAQRLVFVLTVIVVLVAAFSGLFTLTAEERQMLRAMIQGADQLSRGITSATWHAMLADRRKDAYQVMETIARKQGIDRIRMFDRTGRMTFSTNPEDVRGHPETSAHTCTACHTWALPLQKADLSPSTQIYRRGKGRILVMYTPVPNEPSCSQAACHAHPASHPVLGLVELHVSLEPVDNELGAMKARVLVRVLVEIALISICILVFTHRFVNRPIRQLVESARAISNMDLDRPVRVDDTSEEIAGLARALELMRIRLKAALAEIREFAQTLERKVAERTQELQAAQQKLQQSERLASLGQLAASVAHEINNPISGVLNLSMLMQRILGDGPLPAERTAEFKKYLAQVTHETARVGRIVSDLLAFSRRGKPQRVKTDLNRVLAATLALVDHKLKLANIQLETNLCADLPEVLCDRSQMQQVFLNLILNAAEAVQTKSDGRIWVSSGVSADARSVWVSIQDSGEGIPEENLARIFEPFFTTKPEGKGVGLGLAVSYGIVQAHGGEIEVRSQAGKGAVFTVTLPLQAPEVVNG